MKKYIAEFVGTFILSMIVIASLFIPGGWPTAIMAGVALAIIVLMIGAISGAHVNPGITLGALTVGKISKNDAVAYVSAQLLGGLAAFLVARGFGLEMPDFVADFSVMAFLAETIGMVIFSFGVASVLFRVRGEASTAVVVGGSLLVGAYIAASLGSYALLNPAVALGVKVWNVSSFVAPLVGGVIGMWLYRYLYLTPVPKSHE